MSKPILKEIKKKSELFLSKVLAAIEELLNSNISLGELYIQEPKVYKALQKWGGIKKKKEEIDDQLPEKLFINKLKLKELKKLIEQESDDGKTKTKYITKDEKGNFLIKGEEIVLSKTKNNTNYYILFDALYTESDPEGFCSYKRLEKIFRSKGKPHKNTQKEKRTRIRNARNELFKQTKLPKEVGGENLIQTRQGEGLRLYNPKI